MSLLVKYKCDICGLEFKSEERYKKHSSSCKNTKESMADQYKIFAEQTLEITNQGLNEIY